MLGGNLSIKMSGLGSSFHFEEYNSILSEVLKVYALASIEGAYKEPEQHVSLVFMASGG